MDNLRRSLTRQILLLVVGASYFLLSFLSFFAHFLADKGLFNAGSKFREIPGTSIVSPMAYSLHVAGVLVTGAGILWLALACRRRGITFHHWLASFLATLPFFLIFLFTSHLGYGTDWPPPWPFVFLLLFPHALALLFGFMPLLFHRGQGPPRKEPQAAVVRLEGQVLRRIWILAAILLLAWLLGALYVQSDWSRDKGFDSGFRHMIGANLPVLPAAAAFLLLLTMPMSPRAQKILFAFIALLQTLALAATILHPFKGGEQAAFIGVPLAIALHAGWLWVSLKLLEPIYGFNMSWMKPRSSVD